MAGSRNMSSGMQERLNLSRRVTPPTLTDFDDSDAVPAVNAQALMQIQPAGLHKDVILISLLKGWCEANGKSASKSQRLYKKMFRKLQENKFISPTHIEALKQCNYDVLLKTLVSWSLSSSSEDSPDGARAGALLPFNHFIPSPEQDHSSFFQQRYEKDFFQKELIGEGGFGKVYKVQHKLDKEHYAVKKVKVTKKKSCCFQSMQREIKTLACLNHPNVVRYHQAWFGEEFHEVSRQTNKHMLMLDVRSFNDLDAEEEDDDEDDEDDEEEEEEGQEEGEKDGEDSIYSKSKNVYSNKERPSILKPTTPIITEVIETKTQSHSQQTSMSTTVCTNGAEADPFDPNVTVQFEDERFDSGELVNDFFTQTSENVESIKPLAGSKKGEEFSNILFNGRPEDFMQDLNRKTITDVRSNSLESSDTSSSTVIFQNLESDETDCDDFHLPSLKERIVETERKSSRAEYVSQSHQTEKRFETSSKTNTYEEINVTAKTKSKKIVQRTIIPVTSATAALLSTITSTLSSSTHLRSKTQYALSSRPARSIRDSKFRRSISWDGQESSPEMDTSYWSRSRTSRSSLKKRCYLYIQMELCASTLRLWLSERNEREAKTENQFDVVNEKANLNIYQQILEGMDYIHAQGILHRDVTPKNIFLSGIEDGRTLIKIGDFGLAREDVATEPKTPMRFQQDQDVSECSMDPCGSQSYTSGIGTETYAAPEQLDGTTYDNKSDMYSMGLILFELFHPFGTGMERFKCLNDLRRGSIPQEIKTRWPTQYSAIQRLTRQDSKERPSASDLLTGDMYPSKDKIIESQADEIQKLKQLLAERDAEIGQLKESRNCKT